jgi:gamma-glutamyltranspeptidase/glutathione hydrolase
MTMSKINGVVAAGHEATANAGKEILEAGGNAVDAIIASAFTACIAEPLLTGLGAGGYMLIHDAKSKRQELLDFAITMPGKSLAKKPAKLTPTPVDFGETIQMFHGGHSSVGVPGFVAGLCEAHKKYGSIPLKELVLPAQRLAKKGVKISKQQGYLIEILFGVISITPDSKKLFVKNDERLKEGENFFMPEIIDSLAEVTRTNGKSLYNGELSSLIIKTVQDGGGLITANDLADYKVVSRKPAHIRYRGSDVYTNPPPSSGGPLIAHSLSLLSHFDIRSMGWHSPKHLQHLLEVMLNTNEARKSILDESLHDEDILERLLATELISGGSKKISSRLGNTTHISIIDGKGNSVSMTSSNGSGSGVAVPDTGILLNNILGEEDLNPQGFHKHPVGMRMTSMMSPTIVTQGGHPVLSVGSAGSNRIRSAVLQVISNVLDFEMGVLSAIDASRIHSEGVGSAVEVEKGIPLVAAEKLAQAGHQVSLWKEKNLFFGGVQAVVRNPLTNELSGAGDPRRGGVAVIAK